MKSKPKKPKGCRALMLALMCVAWIGAAAQPATDTIKCASTWYTVRLDSTWLTQSRAYRTDSVFYQDGRYGVRPPAYQLQIRAASTGYTHLLGDTATVEGKDTLRVTQLFVMSRMLGSATILDSVWIPLRIKNLATGVEDTIIELNRALTSFQGSSVDAATFSPVAPFADSRPWRIEWVNGAAGFRDDHYIYIETQRREWLR